MRIGMDPKTGLVCAVKMQINKGGMEVKAVLVETNTPVANALKLPPYVVKAGVKEAATGMTVEWNE